MGVIDTGLDVRHADFRNADGTTRVGFFLQVGVPPRGKANTPEGDLEIAGGCTLDAQAPCAVYSEADINEMLANDSDALPRDLVGHGTHVTSIAAGNGGLMHYFHAEGTIGGACLTGNVCSEGACVDVGGGRSCARSRAPPPRAARRTRAARRSAQTKRSAVSPRSRATWAWRPERG
ncbi:MAG: S8 family serine peptidase [Polyangiaceae bacterium]